MASSATLSLFMPNPGEATTQTTTSGAKVFSSTKTGEDLNSFVFPNQEGKVPKIIDVGIKEPTAGDPSSEDPSTTSTFGGPSKGTSYIGNDADNTVVYGGGARKPTIETKGGDDTFISMGRAVRNGEILSGDGNDQIFINNAKSLRIGTGDGDDSLFFGGMVKNSDLSLGDGADEVFFSGKVQNTWINLGGKDEDIDQIHFATKEDLLGNGNRIIEADDGDMLIFGGEDTYTFDTTDNAFVNGDDSISFG
jgi:hypothetical protein